MSPVKNNHRTLPQTPQAYYELPFAKQAFPSRLTAIANAVGPGSTLIDLGCNDGRIGCHLLRTGRASCILAIDSEDLIVDKPSAMTFIRADIRDIDFQALEPVDLVLALNVVHHLVGDSRDVAKAMIQAVLGLAPAVILEMGSFTEQGPWGWRQSFAQYWRDDEQMFDDLFGSAQRQAILRYPAMGGGHRMIWRLQRQVAT